ncbi:Na+/H+ antiporter subunit E [bacterium AH-315-B06]|nr:Na+/H+ antiporter subunit E [bacterium AH-315-B06]
MVRAVSLVLTLFATWLLLSGVYEPLYIVLGLGSCIVAVVIGVRMEVVDHESHPIQLTRRFPGYLLWLAKEIVVANIDISKQILKPRLDIQPRVIRVKPSQRDELGLVIYANSITLTPGTVTIDIDDGEMVVHALTADSAADLQSGEMDRRVTALEGAA